MKSDGKKTPLKGKIHNIIFTTNGRYAYLFDVWLLIFIVLSCIGVILESVPSIEKDWGRLLLLQSGFLQFCYNRVCFKNIFSKTLQVI